jgi:hypothetical protein
MKVSLKQGYSHLKKRLKSEKYLTQIPTGYAIEKRKGDYDEYLP